MILIVHSETTEANIQSQLGRAEYSYFFVLREFRPVLERIGVVVPVTDPKREVDRIWRNATAQGQACVFLSFSPPHRTEIRLACPTIPVFAWEFDTLPDEIWDHERRNDWCFALRRLGQAIVHSEDTVRVVRAALGEQFPVTSIPSPVWDRFAKTPSRQAPGARRAKIGVRGVFVDSRELDFTGMALEQDWTEPVRRRREAFPNGRALLLTGIVYTSVFNPEDGRKNWPDMVASFCRVFEEEPDATLLLKLTHHDGTAGMALLLRLLYRLAPFQCRVVLIHGFLDDAAYAAMVDITSYVVNTAHGEGQCLPLMEFMSAGKPAIAPPHTGMSDYLTAENAFLVGFSPEPTFWPQDPRRALRAMRQRIDAASLDRAFAQSFATARDAPETYFGMASAATAGLAKHCAMAVVEAKLRRVIGDTLEAAGARASEPGEAPALKHADAAAD